MFLPDYRSFYDRLLEQSEKYIQKHRLVQGNFKKLIEGETDENFLNNYRSFTFAKSTKTLHAIIPLVEMGNYEDALILSRSVMECYLSQRYMANNFNYSTLANMIQYPVGTNAGVLSYSNGVLKRKEDGTEFEYNIVNTDRMSIGKDKKYYYDLYNFLCEMAHCNISQLAGYYDSDFKLNPKSDFNMTAANLIPLFLYCKLFENIVLDESNQFDTAEEEQEAIKLLIELTEFLYLRLHNLYDSLEKGKVSFNYAMRHIAHDTMNSLKEQTGRVDKAFVTVLEKKYKPKS